MFYGLADCGCSNCSKGQLTLGRPLHGFGDFTSDAETAMQASPNYFVWWYSAKSILLVAAVAALAYYIGKEHSSP